MDPDYENVLQYVREMHKEGKFYNISPQNRLIRCFVVLKEGCIWVPSIISQLTGKYDYSAGIRFLTPFSEVFPKFLSQEARF